MNIYKDDLIDFTTEKKEKKSMSPTIDFIAKKEKNTTYPTVEIPITILMDGSPFAFFKENSMGMLPELALLIEEQQRLRLKEKDDKIAVLKTQIDQMEFLLMCDNSTALSKDTIVFPKDLSELKQNFPNPVFSQTTVDCFVPSSNIDATLEIISADGKKIKSIVIRQRGNVKLELDLSCLTDGTYAYQLTGDKKILQRKEMIVAR